MNRRVAVPLLTLVAAALITSCGSTASTTSTSAAAATTTSAPATAGTVSGVRELQDAYIAAGGDCEGDLEDLNAVTLAVASGSCPGSGTVLSTYVSHESAENSVQVTSTMTDRIGSTLILGDNWVVNPSGGDVDATDDLADALGGQVIRRERTPITSLDDALTVDDALEVYQHVDGSDCDSPVDMSDDSTPVYLCGDGAIIVTTGTIAETKAEQQDAANSIAEGTKDTPGVGTPVVGRWFTIVVPDSLDARAVAIQVDGTAADDA